jgi:hypothetical protein
MKTKQALNIAIHAIEQEIKIYNVDANMYEKLGADYPLAISASKRRKKLRAAIEILKGLLSSTNMS